jgi:hypothetical protein
MSHDINRMIYVGEVPWHGLGVRLPARASYEEVVQAAGFYEAVEQDVFVPPNPRPVPDRKALVRGDTGQHLAVVGKSYEVVQFSEVARPLVEAAGDVKESCRCRATRRRAPTLPPLVDAGVSMLHAFHESAAKHRRAAEPSRGAPALRVPSSGPNQRPDG